MQVAAMKSQIGESRAAVGVATCLVLGVVAPAVLLGAYALAPALAVVAYVALLPWAILYADDRCPRTSSWWYVLGAYVAWMACYTALANYAWFAVPGMGAVLFVPYVVFGPALKRIHHRFHLPRTLTLPLVWVATEWVRATFTVSHFDLYGLGYSQARFPILIQFADITGFYGISFLVAAVNGLLADLFFALRDAGWKPGPALRTRRIVASAAAVAAGFALATGYGAFRLATARHVDGPRLAIVQPNVLHHGRNVFGVHLTQVILTDRLVRAGAADLILWPENAILDYVRREGLYLEDLGWLAKRKEASLIIGAMGRSSRRPGKSTNGAYLVDGEGRITGEYEKIVLFPWSEAIPFDDALGAYFPPAQRLQRALVRKGWGFLSNGVPGDGMKLFHLPWQGSDLPFAALICIENSWAPLPADAGRLGARFFVNLTSEGIAGGPTQEQLMRISMLRAVENRISYVRCGNTGISSFIDPEGRLLAVLRGERGGTIDDAGVLVLPVPLSAGGATLYSRSHDTFAKGCVIATLLLLAWTFRPGRRLSAAAILGAAFLFPATGCVAPPQLGRDPAAVAGSLERGQRLCGQRRPQLAIPDLAAACATAEGCSAALPFLMESYRMLAEDENAAALFGTIAARYPSLAAEASGDRGYFLERVGEFVAAESAYRESLSLAPSAQVYGFLGRLHLRMTDPPSAARVLREGSSRFPDDLNLRYLLARASWFAGDLDRAASLAEQILADRPDHSEAWILLGRVRLARGDDAGASDAFAKALEREPSGVTPRYWLARMALRAGLRPRAQELLREIVTIETELGRGSREE
jgi:apolipoprotein N-acyltransferase